MAVDRKQSFRADLTLKLIKRLSLDEAPVGVDAAGRLLFQPNPQRLPGGEINPNYRESYILWDASPHAPPGFGVKVSTKKTYVLRRKVHGISRMPTVGNFADFNKIEDARARAAELARVIVETGLNPNEVARKEAKSEYTLREAFSRYRAHLVSRTQRPASDETLRVLDRAVRKHERLGWLDSKVSDIAMDVIERTFQDTVMPIAAKEQAFRAASTAVRWVISIEEKAAVAERRTQRVKADPFEVLVINKMYRSRAQIENDRKERGVRRPLHSRTSLGAFVEAAWSKQRDNDNETGVHFLLLALLWGCRKSEHAKLVWGELLREFGGAGVGRQATSHVFLGNDPKWGPYVFFHGTKNGHNHRLPIAPLALELLKRRQRSAAQEAIRRGFDSKSRQFVFPAKSKFSKSGHYSDPTDLLHRLRDEIEIEKLSPHDLRRSFGSLMSELQVPKEIQACFLNHAKSNVTELYTESEWEGLREWMARIEEALFRLAPNAYNALKPVDWPAISAPEPHVCKPPKPRTGRPRKDGGRAAGVPEVAPA